MDRRAPPPPSSTAYRGRLPSVREIEAAEASDELTQENAELKKRLAELERGKRVESAPPPSGSGSKVRLTVGGLALAIPLSALLTLGGWAWSLAKKAAQYEQVIADVAELKAQHGKQRARDAAQDQFALAQQTWAKRTVEILVQNQRQLGVKIEWDPAAKPDDVEFHPQPLKRGPGAAPAVQPRAVLEPPPSQDLLKPEE